MHFTTKSEIMREVEYRIKSQIEAGASHITLTPDEFRLLGGNPERYLRDVPIGVSYRGYPVWISEAPPLSPGD